MDKIRVMIADDHKLVRETWCYIINSDPRFVVVAACGNSDTAVQLAIQYEPHIVLMDITLPPKSGIAATGRIKKQFPQMKVMGLTMHANKTYLTKMLQSGADGYVTKNSPKEEMIEALLSLMEGKKFICAEMSAFFADTE